MEKQKFSRLVVVLLLYIHIYVYHMHSTDTTQHRDNSAYRAHTTEGGGDTGGTEAWSTTDRGYFNSSSSRSSEEGEASTSPQCGLSSRYSIRISAVLQRKEADFWGGRALLHSTSGRNVCFLPESLTVYQPCDHGGTVISWRLIHNFSWGSIIRQRRT